MSGCGYGTSGRLWPVVTAVHFIATAEDHAAMLDYLGEPKAVTLHPWPVVSTPAETWTREQALAARQIMIVHRGIGAPAVIRPGDPALTESTKASLFNRLNWDRVSPEGDDGLVDSNASPVIFWESGASAEGVLHGSSLGSQADSMSAIGADYERWVTRTMGWIKRRGTKVWGLERGSIRPDLNIHLSHVSAVYALPRALDAMERGVPVR